MGQDYPQTLINVIDVRCLEKIERHPFVFHTFDTLAEGEAVLLIHDHTPTRLYAAFAEQRQGLFTWDIVSDAPQECRVRLGKAHRAH
jgi:uncharacterized protein (DUF2249 family)